MAPAAGPRPDGRRSWLLAGLGTLAMGFTFGMPYSYGILLGPVGATFDVPRVTLSTVFSVELFVFYAGAGLIGIVATRLPARAVLLACGLLTAALAPSLYVVSGYAGLVVVFGLLGAAIGTVFVVLASVVPQWFEARRGIATGVLFAGAGVSLQVIPPAWQLAFARLGVRGGFLAIVLASAAAFLLVGAVARRPPWVERTTPSGAALRGWLAATVRTRRFAVLFVGIGLSFAWYYVLAAFSVDLFAARGLSRTAAAVVFGFIGGVSVVSRLGSGAVADRLGFRETFLGSLGFALVGSLLLLVPGRAALWAAVVAYGLGLGGIGALYIPVILSRYAPEMDTAVVGLYNVAFGVFAMIAPPVAITLVEATGSYRPAILLAAATTVVSLVGTAAGTRG